MFRVARYLPPFLLPGVFAIGWLRFPDLLQMDSLKLMSSILTLAWALELLLYRKAWDMTGMAGLSSREQDRLAVKVREVRRRLWITGAGCLVCVAVVWLITAMDERLSLLSAIVIGLLAGLSLSSLALIAMWFDETSAFMDQIRLKEANAKKRAEYAKTMAGLAKDPK